MNSKQTKACKKCKELINKKAKRCPHCGAKQKMPIWLIVILIIMFSSFISSLGDDSENSNDKTDKNKVTVIDFSSMTDADIDIWCDTHKVSCTIQDEYSDSVSKDSFVSQSVDVDKTIYEEDEIVIVFSLGKEPSTEYKNALKKAESYSESLHMSKKGIYDQLTSEYGEQFPADAAQYAIDNMEADWKANALAKAKSYQETLNMSKKGIYDQLISEYGEEFTKEEAQYAIDHLDD